MNNMLHLAGVTKVYNAKKNTMRSMSCVGLI